MTAREDVFKHLKQSLVELFGVDPATVTLQARIFEDFDLDSIDAVEIMDRIYQLTGKRVPPEQFKAIRTVADLVDVTCALQDP